LGVVYSRSVVSLSLLHLSLSLCSLRSLSLSALSLCSPFVYLVLSLIADVKILVGTHVFVCTCLVWLRVFVSSTESTQKADIVISLLPVKLHSRVFQDCIQLCKNMVTASYISPDVASMHSAAVDRDIILLNEVGLDPGIDHMVAMSNIDRIRAKYASTFFFLLCVCFCFCFFAWACAINHLNFLLIS
jgi:hypothetical protein